MGKAADPKASATTADAPSHSTAITGGTSPTAPTTTSSETSLGRGDAREASPGRGDARGDLLFVHSPSDDGQGLRVIRKRENRIEFGELRALEEGRPLHGEVVQLHQREEHERLFDVEVMLDAAHTAPAAHARSGPAQVATDAYRSNWDAIFGPPAAKPSPGGSGSALN
ncbi:hypothetical protein [Chondromyces apiculatus]|uniref:Uncharacterized protein n=1 Tax=Chondromyces apiculatus DSM 436 TaxID=1192034 RepID=A0A017TFY4_9BACT|nr:hypothetical protein [Chondromyces apiculatus]EYF07506.1 Hypothetical protein CAP_0259 [Chondromyces apiculatus DSM 436]